MTIDERLEFLLKSNESLHEQMQQASSQLARQAENIDKLASTVNELYMVALSHERRLTEGGL